MLADTLSLLIGQMFREIHSAAGPAVDFELLDMALESRDIDFTQVGDYVETKLNSFCKLAEVHIPHFVVLHMQVPISQYNLQSEVETELTLVSFYASSCNISEQYKPSGQRCAPASG